ncbi:hypothetical protein B0H14DRAFT_832830 [Mycena olivaceomarginata]|nr:hypothetical protein B0H14DRAFT_832830 [Mycena olivaceomarginata]
MRRTPLGRLSRARIERRGRWRERGGGRVESRRRIGRPLTLTAGANPPPHDGLAREPTGELVARASDEVFGAERDAAPSVTPRGPTTRTATTMWASTPSAQRADMRWGRRSGGVLAFVGGGGAPTTGLFAAKSTTSHLPWGSAASALRASGTPSPRPPFFRQPLTSPSPPTPPALLHRRVLRRGPQARGVVGGRCRVPQPAPRARRARCASSRVSRRDTSSPCRRATRRMGTSTRTRPSRRLWPPRPRPPHSLPPLISTGDAHQRDLHLFRVGIGGIAPGSRCTCVADVRWSLYYGWRGDGE